MVDPHNAHIRPESSKRESTEVQASEAQRLLNDPAYVRGFNNVREGIIYQLEHMKHDGSADMDDYERELCRVLRTLTSTKRAMSLGIQNQPLREHNFRAKAPEAEETKEG